MANVAMNVATSAAVNVEPARNAENGLIVANAPTRANALEKTVRAVSLVKIVHQWLKAPAPTAEAKSPATVVKAAAGGAVAAAGAANATANVR